MKKTNKILVFLTVLLITSHTLSNWDLTISTNQMSGNITIQAVSICFEGRNKVDAYNRLHQIFCGSQTKYFYSGNGYYDTSLVFNYSQNNQMVLTSCYYEALGQGTYNVYGFGKYLITIKPPLPYDTNKAIKFYFNTLDSKCGTDNWNNIDYHADMHMTYYYNNGNPYVEIGATNPVSFTDTVKYNEQYKEITMWKLFYSRTTPWERNFHAKTTPFPLRPQELEQFRVRQFILGTTVVLDNVFPYGGDTAKYSYNTVNGPFPYNNYFYYPPIPDSINNNVQGKTFTTPGWYYYDNLWNPVYGIKLTAVSGDTVMIKNNTRLWIVGVQEINPPFIYQGDTIIFSSGSTLIKEANSQINTCHKGCLMDSGSTTVWASGSFHKAYENSSLEYYGSPDTINNGGHLEIDGNATLKLGDNTTLIFEGSGTYLKLKSNSQVVLGSNAQIKFINGAYLDANGAAFNNPNGYWQGIVFENAGANNIRNCTFSKAIVALNFYNSGLASFSNPVYNNTFNVQNPNPNEHYKGVYARNIYNIAFNQNTFNLSSGAIGVIIQDASNPPEAGGGGIPSEIDFTNNVFTGGYLQLFIGGYALVNIPVYVYNNTFTSGGWCFAGRMVNGNIKQNNMTRSAYNYTLGLWQSNPNFTDNTIINQSGSGVYFSSAFPVLAPTVDENNHYVWYAGNNRINAYSGDVINMIASKPVTDQGYNYLSLNNSAYYHIYGSISTAEAGYLARYNCWYGSTTPRFYVVNNIIEPGPGPVTVVYNPVASNCQGQINFNSFIINELGNGIYDTIGVSDNNSEITAPIDEIIYSQAVSYKDEDSYFDAITNYKNLLDNYQTSDYRYTALYDLYTCYEGLDTADQTHRDLIFGDLKFYLENKITQYQDDDEFVSTAYNLILMCEAMLENYNEAMDGYEFISLYHPDPEQRMWASMDYGEIQNLLNGMGGGESSNPKVSKQTSHERSRMMNLLKLMDKKPYTKIVKNSFTKASRELETKLNDKNLREDKSIIQKKELIERAKQNINVSRSLTKEQREERRMEDIKLLIKQSDNVTTDNTTNIPQKYSLHQNYPNPFNPTTTIKYELPNDGMITFKIYDILGKEVYSVNEFRKAGIYSITFDGSKYASGVYFYRLESGSYIETKKMVLVK